MRLTKTLTALLVLLAAGLGMACDRSLPTETWNEALIKSAEDNPQPTAYYDNLHPNWRVPPPCPLGTSPRLARNCIPQVPSGPPGE